MSFDLVPGLDAFAVQFQAQLDAAGPPGSEHAVHFCLALGFQAAYGLPPGAIVFECPVQGRTRWDLWIRPPLDLAVEVKYSRPIPSARSRPFTQIYGGLLADFNKLTRGNASQNLVVLASDPRTLRHMTGPAGGQLLPFRLGEERTLLPATVSSLSPSAAVAAESDGPWQPLRAMLAWTGGADEWLLYAWTVNLDH